MRVKLFAQGAWLAAVALVGAVTTGVLALRWTQTIGRPWFAIATTLAATWTVVAVAVVWRRPAWVELGDGALVLGRDVGRVRREPLDGLARLTGRRWTWRGRRSLSRYADVDLIWPDRHLRLTSRHQFEPNPPEGTGEDDALLRFGEVIARAAGVPLVEVARPPGRPDRWINRARAGTLSPIVFGATFASLLVVVAGVLALAVPPPVPPRSVSASEVVTHLDGVLDDLALADGARAAPAGVVADGGTSRCDRPNDSLWGSGGYRDVHRSVTATTEDVTASLGRIERFRADPAIDHLTGLRVTLEVDEAAATASVSLEASCVAKSDQGDVADTLADTAPRLLHWLASGGA